MSRTNFFQHSKRLMFVGATAVGLLWLWGLTLAFASAPVRPAASTRPATSLTPTQVISNPDPINNANFGFAVEAAGDYALVGAPRGLGQGSGTGAVYAYHFDGGAWQETQRLFLQSGGSDRFGQAVDLTDDATTAVVGADRRGERGVDSGAAYVYTRTGQTWALAQELVPSVVMGDARLGYSAAVDEQTIIVSAYQQDVLTYTDAGAAFIFEYDTVSESWVETAMLTPTLDLRNSTLFGWAVDVDGASGTAVVSALSGGADGYGAVYVYERQTSGAWQLVAHLTHDQNNRTFGRAVAVEGNTILVGDAFRHRLHSYERVDGVWEKRSQYQVGGGYFGYNLSLQGDTAVLGAPTANRAHILRRSGGVWSDIGQLETTTSNSGDFFGSDVALTSDGRVLVGAERVEAPNSDAGQAYAFGQLPAPPTATVTLAPANLTVQEGMTATFTVMRTGNLSEALNIRYDVESAGRYPATAVDFVGNELPGDSLNFGVGQAVLTFTVAISDDAQAEYAEAFTVQLNQLTDVLATQGTARATIPNEDWDATIAISPTTQTLDEGRTFSFAVSMTGQITTAVPITYTVVGAGVNPADTADFTQTMTSSAYPTDLLMLVPGQTSSVNIATVDDTIIEPDEGFVVLFEVNTFGVLLTQDGVSGTIRNNDVPPTFDIYLPLVVR